MPDLKHEVVVMNKNTDRLLTLINQLLDFRKVESGNYFLHTEPRDLVVIVEELFNNFQIEKGLTIRWLSNNGQ